MTSFTLGPLFVQIEDPVLRLQSGLPKKVERKVGGILRQELCKQAMIVAIITVLVQNGIQPNRKPEPLPRISEDQVEVVAWMAVRGTLAKV